MVGEMAARNDLIVLNQGGEFTFRRGAEGSIIDLAIAAPRFASRISDWSVLVAMDPLRKLQGQKIIRETRPTSQINGKAENP